MSRGVGPAAPRGRGPLSRHAFLSLYLPAIAIAMGQGIAAPALPILAKSFGVGFGEAALATVLFSFGGLAGTLPTGYFIDRFGRRRVLLVGPVLTALASFLTAFGSPTFAWLLVWRFIGGAASQGWELARLAMVADAQNERERGRLLKWMFQMSATGALFAPSIGGFAAEVDVRIPFVLYGVLTLAAIVPSVWLLPETDPARLARTLAGGAVAPTGSWASVLRLFRTREMSAFLAAQFLANVSRALQGGGVINLYMAYAYDASALTIGLVTTASSAITTPFGFWSGSIVDRWGRKKATVPLFYIMFGAMLVVAWTAFAQSEFAIFVVAFTFMNLIQSMTAGNMQVMGADLAPASGRGRFIGAWRLVGRGGGTAGPALFAWVAEASSYALGFVLLAASALGVAVLIEFFMDETVGREPAPEVRAV